MSHFAHIDNNGIVDQVLVISEENLATGNWGNPAEFVQTSYNTTAGDYKLGADTAAKLVLKSSGSKADKDARNRKNYAGIGYSYDRVRDAFIPPKVFMSWILNDVTCQWESPVPHPNDGKMYHWDEQLLAWVINK
jgi:hypothetical protein